MELEPQQSSYTIKYDSDPSQKNVEVLSEIEEKAIAYDEVHRTRKANSKTTKKGILKTLCEIGKENKTEMANYSDILKKVRRDSIVQQFINKLKLNITHSTLSAKDEIQYFTVGKISKEEEFQSKVRQGKINLAFQTERYELAWILFRLFVLAAVTYINSIKVAFEDIGVLTEITEILIVISIICLFLQIGCMVTEVESWKISFLKNLLYWVEHEELGWDILVNCGLFLELLELPYVSAILIFLQGKNILCAMKNIKRLQSSFVLSINVERYWQLMKIILFNFFIAHILSIVLNLMGSIEVENSRSWYVQKDIPLDSEWYVKYIWGYYWGTNIMLTVGFGDISAENYVEAIFLVFIETFACIILAYNISEVSSILQNISEMEQEKKLKFKIVNQMGEKYRFQDDFKYNVLNHIEKSIDQKQQLHYIEENLIQELPEKIKSEVKREINRNVFKGTYFFKNLTSKTQNLLAEKVNKIFAHPEEIILKNQESWKILILRQGRVALTFRKGNSANNGTVIDEYRVRSTAQPELLSIKFMRRDTIKGDLKSLGFSIMNSLENEEFEHILKEHDKNMFEFYCSQRDRTHHHHFDMEIRNCEICANSKHDKTECPKMHYIALKEHVIYKKEIYLPARTTQRKSSYVKRKKNVNIPLKIYRLYGKEESNELQNQQTFSNIIIPSLSAIGNGGTAIYSDNNIPEFQKKMDKCLSKVEETLKILKEDVSTEDLVFDLAHNYKRYFPKNNPDNIAHLPSLPNKANSEHKMKSSKRMRTVTIL